jgi:SAM-dependent methyltransferase
MPGEIHCPLCAGAEISFYFQDRRRPYHSCSTCGLVFVLPDWHLSRDEERTQYTLHKNYIDDPGYRTFLSRMMHPLIERLTPGTVGLDFGCGTGPALAHMLREAGFTVALYDSFFVPEQVVLDVHYDFICATEVVEHLHRPGLELGRLWALLKPGGWFGIMTRLVLDSTDFASWHYKNDPTHVCFFSAKTWRWWALQHGANIEIIGADVILLQRES